VGYHSTVRGKIMPYDFSIIDSRRYPQETISIGVDEHFFLFCNIQRDRYQLLSRMRDYYKDAQFQSQELASLKREIQLYMIEVKRPDLRNILIDMLSLVDIAITQKRIILGIAD
jgi:hypothetical protein